MCSVTCVRTRKKKVQANLGNEGRPILESCLNGTWTPLNIMQSQEGDVKFVSFWSCSLFGKDVENHLF